MIISTKNFGAATELVNSPDYLRICRREQMSSLMRQLLVNYDDNVYVYFSSDRSRSYRGFRLEYTLSCNLFEYIPIKNGLFEAVRASFSKNISIEFELNL